MLLLWSNRLAHSSVTGGNLVYQIWIGFGDLRFISSQRSRGSEKKGVSYYVLPTRLTGKLAQVSIWGPLSQSCYGPPRHWPGWLVHVVKKFSRSIFGANPILPPLHRPEHFSSARRCTIAPRLSSGLPPLPNLTWHVYQPQKWKLGMQYEQTIFSQLRKGLISVSWMHSVS